MVCVSQVLKGAAVLQIECLQRRCEEFLSRSLSISNCITRWRLAHWHSCMHLRDRVSSMLLFETPLPVYHSSSRDTVSTMPCLPPASSSPQYYVLSPQCQFQPSVLCHVSPMPVPALSTMPCLPSASSSPQYYALSPQCQYQPSVLCHVSPVPVPALSTMPCLPNASSSSQYCASSPSSQFQPCS